MTPLALAPMLLTLAGTPPGPDALPTLTLDQALVELDRQSLTLAQARSRADEATGVVRQALSPLLPTASADLRYVRNSDAANLTLPIPTGPRTVTIQPLESTTLSGQVRVPLLVPSAWYDLSAARHAARAASLSAEATRLTLRIGLAQAAHQAAAAEEQVAASARAVDSAEELVRSAARRVEAGTAAPIEVTRARAELARRQSDLAGARAVVESSWLGVGVMLGRDQAVRVEVPDVEQAASPDAQRPGPELVSEALERRPELAIDAAQRDTAEARIRSSWALLAPQLSVSAAGYRSDEPLISGKKESWSVVVDLSWQLYDGGLRYGKLRQARAQEEEARAALELERLSVSREVLDARRSVEVAAERLRLAHAQADLAGESAASIRRSFAAGVASSLDVIDANDRLYLAESGLADARARLAQARLSLLLALGRAP